MTRESQGTRPNDDSEHQQLRRLLELSERERLLVAYDIHDGFVQDVVSAQLGIDTMLDHLAASDPDSVAPLLRVRAFIRKAIAEARRVVSELRPATIEDRGLVEAIQFLVDEADTAGHLEVDFSYPADFSRLSLLLERSLARIVQESLTNVTRHARTKHAEIRLKRVGNKIHLEIEDRGIGFDIAAVEPGHFGLEGIRERARVFDGETIIDSQLGRGTLISVVVPAEMPTENPQSRGKGSRKRESTKRRKNGQT
jgi:signal transduction histidine kinase